MTTTPTHAHPRPAGALTGVLGRTGPLGALGALVLLMAALSACLGALHISPGQLAAIVGDGLGVSLPWDYLPHQSTVFWSIRLPRICLGMLVGASLAVSGAALQGMFRNPLADPGLIGVSGGGAMGAALVIVLLPAGWLASAGALALPLAAFVGGLMAVIIVYRLATQEGQTSVSSMLLAGIAVNALVGSVIGLLTFVSDDAALRSLTMWSLGSLGGATWRVVLLVTPCVLVAIWWTTRQADALNALLLGESQARHLGVDVVRLRRHLVAMVALAVGAGVGFTGLIGFVGLVVPHMLRLGLSPDHKLVVPGSALLGAALLLGADLVCRVAVAPAEMPIGVVTSLLGAPFFLWLMLRGSGRREA